MNTISSVSSSVSRQTIAALQGQLLRDSPPENGQNTHVSSDFKALQATLKSGDVADAQTDLARLRLDTQMADPPAANSPVDSDYDGSTGTAQLWNQQHLNTIV